MKSAIFASSIIAALASFVAADTDNSNCWMSLGDYSPGGVYCAQPLSDFSDQDGCKASQNQCTQEYTKCKAKTQSTSACLQLMTRCQLIGTFCDKYCAPDGNGNVPGVCYLQIATTWDGHSDPNGVSTTAPTNSDPDSGTAPDPVNQQAQDTPIASTSAAAAYNAPKTTAAVYNAKTSAAAYSAPVAAYNAPAAYNYAPSAYQQTVAYVAPQSTIRNVYAYASTPVAAAYGAATTAAAAYKAYNTPVAANNYVSYTPTVGICSIPTAYATPIAGYHAPIVACNDLSDYAAKPWKQYNSHYTSQCPTYSPGWEAHACTEACTAQYNNCISMYANTFSTYKASGYKVRRGGPKNEKRHWWLYGAPTTSTTKVTYGATKETLQSATTKCYAQYDACWTANRYLTNSGTCSAGGIYRAPSSQSGYKTYNAASNSYGSYNTGNSYIKAGSYGGSTTNNKQYYKK